MYEEALELLKKINNLGFEGYIVGGFPRDKYLGINNDDIDICTNMKSEEATKYFKIDSITNFGTYKINNFEITTYRKDIYINNRYPRVEFVKTLDEDLLRRDFVINTLCIDLNGNYVDKFGAINDIENKTIKTIKKPDISFKEDPLRIIRALRFKIDLNFLLSNDIIECIKKNINLIDNISTNRLKKEIEKCKNKEKLIKVIEDERKNSKFN